jgi:hypothetical protein
MKLMLVFSLALGICAAADQPAKKTAPAPSSARPTTIPPGAVEAEPGFFRYTDAKGTAWLLHRTPFGVMAVQDKAVEEVTASDAGDNVRFAKTTPAGRRTWERKKSELTQYERELWEQQQRDQAAGK